jgi:peptidoglycan/xylan/chitin deacetylase (PgdA/CDA1 family)
MDEGAIVRAAPARRSLSLVFTGGDFADGGPSIREALKKRDVKAGFFFTGDFYRAPANAGLIRLLAADGHYLGPHSDKHLLYCAWEDRNKLLVTREEFLADLRANEEAMAPFLPPGGRARCFIPPYEWANAAIARWTREAGAVLFNLTPGTGSNADYTTPDMPEYASSAKIFDGILAYEARDPRGLEGFFLLIHIGTHPARTDKFYFRLGELLDILTARGYAFTRIDEALASCPPPGTVVRAS